MLSSPKAKKNKNTDLLKRYKELTFDSFNICPYNHLTYNNMDNTIIADRLKAIEEGISLNKKVFNTKTKPVTAVAIMTLHDQGKLNLDDKVSKYIPEFSNTQVYKNVDGKHTTDPQKKQLTIKTFIDSHFRHPLWMGMELCRFHL